MRTFNLYAISHKTSGEYWKVSAASPEDAVGLINVNEKRNLEMKEILWVDTGKRFTFGAVQQSIHPKEEK